MGDRHPMRKFCGFYHRLNFEYVFEDFIMAEDSEKAQGFVVVIHGDASPIAAFDVDCLKMLLKQTEALTEEGYLQWLEIILRFKPMRHKEIQAIIDRHRADQLTDSETE